MPEITRRQLREAIAKAFTLDELRTLADDMGVDYEDLEGSTKTSKALALVQYAHRRSTLNHLIDLVQRTRPKALPPGSTAAQPDNAIGRGATAKVDIHHYPPPKLPLHNLPPANPHFTGRKKELAAIYDALHAKNTLTITQAITGLGGVGKTQLALAYAHAHQHEYPLIWLVQANDAATLDTHLRQLGTVLNLPLANQDADTARKMTLARLNGMAEKWLLIYDNVDTLRPAELHPYLPGGRGHVLVTTRRTRWGRAQTLRLGVFTVEEAADFWRQRVGVNRQLTPTDDAMLAELATELGYLPLAMEQAAAYMEARGKTPGDYLGLYQKRRAELWARQPPPDDYHATITTTWEMAFEHARQTPGAAELLNLCCFLAPDDIPLAGLWAELEAWCPAPLQEKLADELAQDDALTALTTYALVTVTDGRLAVHRLVQQVARERMGAERAKVWAEAAVNLLSQAYRFDLHDMSTWEENSQMLPHLTTAANLAAEFGMETARAAWLNNATGFYLCAFGDFAGARPYCERALAIREKVLGPDHPDTAQSLNNLGYLLQAMGDFAGARPYYERALAIREKALGPDHQNEALLRSTATSLNNLGYLLQTMGDFAGARPYCERALAITEKALGPDHPDTATSLNNLGYLLRATGDFAGARPYYERALAIWEKALGPDHPDTATSLNNLGYLLQTMGDFAGARPYYERALAIREKVLGPDHPDTAQSLNNLGALLRATGDFAGARPYCERALAIWEKALGPDHPDTATSLNNLGALLRATGDFAGARDYYQRALAILEAKLGPEHSHTKIVRDNLQSLS